MAMKTLVSLAKYDGGLHNITIAYDDATVDRITQASLDLIHQFRMAEGDKLSVGIICVKED
jgi:hypothetical protein